MVQIYCTVEINVLWRIVTFDILFLNPLKFNHNKDFFRGFDPEDNFVEHRKGLRIDPDKILGVFWSLRFSAMFQNML